MQRPTWNEIIEMEPNLERLAEKLERFSKKGSSTKWLVWGCFGKPTMQKLVGHYAEPSKKEKREPVVNGVRAIKFGEPPTPLTPPDPRMITSEAYEVAYKALIDALCL